MALATGPHYHQAATVVSNPHMMSNVAANSYVSAVGIPGWASVAGGMGMAAGPVLPPPDTTAMLHQAHHQSPLLKPQAEIDLNKKRLIYDDVLAVSEDESDREKRRRDRNVREQQRSHRITEQIAHLRIVLSEANIPFKPDKYSTLIKVVEYVKALQERSDLLDKEHLKLLDTISKTTEIVNNQYAPAKKSSESTTWSNDLLADGSSSPYEDDTPVFVQSIDYKGMFAECGIPLALASIDGRFLDCNTAFEVLLGYERCELLPKLFVVPSSSSDDQHQRRNLSLFNLLCREGMETVFGAMSEMLKQPGDFGTGQVNHSQKFSDYWSGPVKLGRIKNTTMKDLTVNLNVTLVRTKRGRPKFFTCSLTIIEVVEDEKWTDSVVNVWKPAIEDEGT